MMRLRRISYWAGFRPKVGSVFYSPSLDTKHAGDCSLCGRPAIFDGHAVGKLWVCNNVRNCREYAEYFPTPRQRFWRALDTACVVADNILHAAKRESKMWTWHR